MAITKALQRLYSMNSSGIYYMEALSIAHSALPDNLHITNYRGGFPGRASSQNVTFEYCPFQVKLPNKDTTGNQAIEITLANDEQNFIDDIEIMATRPYESAKCWYRVYLSTQINADGFHTQQLNPAWRYDISRITVTPTVISMTASRENMHNRAWPRKQYRADLFPGLDK